jgi:hypothetical protein
LFARGKQKQTSYDCKWKKRRLADIWNRVTMQRPKWWCENCQPSSVTNRPEDKIAWVQKKRLRAIKCVAKQTRKWMNSEREGDVIANEWRQKSAWSVIWLKWFERENFKWMKVWNVSERSSLKGYETVCLLYRNGTKDAHQDIRTIRKRKVKKMIEASLTES